MQVDEKDEARLAWIVIFTPRELDEPGLVQA